jgi:YrbI family 3-deoxy-D-manno-octulosonate 8-phosphate phosphatase
MIEKKALNIQILFLDVDGVLTEGRITLDEGGKELKTFHVKDGQGLKLLLSGGVDVVIVTARESRALVQRARELGIEAVYQGISDKRSLCRGILTERNLDKKAACSVGDDLPDLGMFRESGLRIAVADAAKEVREAADFITRSRGGLGAVREVCELILKSQGKWAPILEAYR